MLQTIDYSNVFVVIPVFNEEQTILEVVARSVHSAGYSIVIVDDGSTIPVLLEPGNRFYLIRHQVNLGQGAALQTGFEFAKSKGAEYVVTFDADGQHQTSDIEKLLLPLYNNETDICLGSRFISRQEGNISKGRIFTLKVARVINFFFTGLMLSDVHNGLRSFNKKAIQRIFLNENRMAHATEIIVQVKHSKLRIKEIPVSILYSDYSKKKGQTPLNGIKIFLDLLLNKLFE
ncbi:MAG TPA: glycosyltransferase family 2 protein [Allocoleopsis sp.]